MVPSNSNCQPSFFQLQLKIQLIAAITTYMIGATGSYYSCGQQQEKMFSHDIQFSEWSTNGCYMYTHTRKIGHTMQFLPVKHGYTQHDFIPPVSVIHICNSVSDLQRKEYISQPALHRLYSMQDWESLYITPNALSSVNTILSASHQHWHCAAYIFRYFM